MEARFSPQTVVVASQAQVWCDLQGEAALLNLKNSTYYGLNAVGTRVWQLLQQPITIGKLCEALVGEYAVDPARCEADVKGLLEQLAKQGLLDIREC